MGIAQSAFEPCLNCLRFNPAFHAYAPVPTDVATHNGETAVAEADWEEFDDDDDGQVKTAKNITLPSQQTHSPHASALNTVPVDSPVIVSAVYPLSSQSASSASPMPLSSAVVKPLSPPPSAPLTAATRSASQSGTPLTTESGQSVDFFAGLGMTPTSFTETTRVPSKQPNSSLQYPTATAKSAHDKPASIIASVTPEISTDYTGGWDDGDDGDLELEIEAALDGDDDEPMSKPKKISKLGIVTQVDDD